jgi:hypothetical protein
VIAADRRLDQARAVIVSTACERKAHKGRVPVKVRLEPDRRGAQLARNRVAHHRPQFLVIH